MEVEGRKVQKDEILGVRRKRGIKNWRLRSRRTKDWNIERLKKERNNTGRLKE